MLYQTLFSVSVPGDRALLKSLASRKGVLQTRLWAVAVQATLHLGLSPGAEGVAAPGVGLHSGPH